MKKTLAALAVLGAFAGSAAAADVQLYGVVDEGFIYTNTKVTDEKSDNQFQLGSGLNLGSRWGLKGTEDLGNGYKVGFKLESGFNADTGTLQENRLFRREAGLTLYSLYRILYEAFVDPSIGAQDYIIPADGDYKNLDISNLKKVSASEFHKVHPSGRKKKITKKEYEEICELRKNGLSYRAIAAKYRVSHYVIQKLLRNGFYTKGD